MIEKMRVVLVDDHPLFRQGVAHALAAEPDIEIVGEGASAAESLRLAESLLPDVILLDIGIPGGGIHAARAITAACPVTKIVMLTVSKIEDDVLQALKAGARGYVLKGVAAEELVGVLHAIWAGEVWITPSLASSLLLELSGGSTEPPPAGSPLADLTARELSILELVAAGHSNKEVGQ